MIKSFGNKIARDVYDGANSKQARKLPKNLHEKARRLLDQLNTSPSIEFLKIPPGNRLEMLTGDLAGFRSLRINDQWRIIFRWSDNNEALDVKILDYH